MIEAHSGRRQFIILALAMVISIWVHILGLAVWQYVEPEPAKPIIPPLALEIELPPPPEEPKPKEDTPKEEIQPKPKAAEADPTPEKSDQPRAAEIPIPQPTPDDGGGENPGYTPEPQEETISLESTAPKYLSYLGQVKAAVKNHWIFPPQARSDRAHGRLTAVFTLNNEGELLRILVEESSGHPILDHAALEAVRGASPFPPFPEHIKLKRLNIRANFDYRIKYVGLK